MRSSFPKRLQDTSIVRFPLCIRKVPLMSLQYLLPCPECSESIKLVAAQAGQDIECPDCGHSFEAPRLGELKRLETVGDSSSKAGGQASFAKRALFSGGLLVLVLFGVPGLLLNNYANSLIIELNLEETFINWNKSIDELSPEELFQEWTAMDYESGLGEWREQVHARYEAQGKILRNVSYGILSVAALGLLMLVSSFFVRGR